MFHFNLTTDDEALESIGRDFVAQWAGILGEPAPVLRELVAKGDQLIMRLALGLGWDPGEPDEDGSHEVAPELGEGVDEWLEVMDVEAFGDVDILDAHYDIDVEDADDGSRSILLTVTLRLG